MSKEKCLAECSDGSECQAYAMDGSNRCRHHGGKSTGPKTEEGKQQVRQNAQSHGLYTSEAVFLENARESHKDAYHAIHESLCSRWELQHGQDIPTHVEKELSHVALDMVKLDMASEYQAENAIDESKPITEEQEELTSEGVFKKEEVSKVESLKTDIRRENRLLLKDMGIYNSPEQMQAETNKSISEALTEALRD